jgi:hypothetical protein
MFYVPSNGRFETASITENLEKAAIVSAAYNSFERYAEHASTCAENTRDTILREIRQWARSNDHYRICWLSGKAGTGKSTIAHTIAKECDQEQRLGFSFFFSRRNKDRSNITRFIPTLAYQLSAFLPAVQDPIKRAVAKNPAIFHQSPKDQLTQLIVDPLQSIVDSISMIIIIVDGLDEYTGGVPLAEVVALFRDLPDRLPFRIFFTSRPEPRIQEIFNSPSMTRQTYHLELQDFSSRDEVGDLLRSRLLAVRDKRGLPLDWPSVNDLDDLSKQSDGLYIYAETVIRFIDDEYGDPPERLQSALTAYSGIDHLYDQVLIEARRYPFFSQVTGSILYLADPLDIDALVELLQLPSRAIRLALRGCFSILVIPDDEKGYIRPYHTSLRDFFLDRDRAKEHFLDPLECNQFIMDRCVELLYGGFANAEGRESFRYACRYWCLHLRLAESCTIGVYRVRSSVKTRMIELMKNLQSRWWIEWIIIMGNHESLEQVHKDLRIAVAQFKVCQPQPSGIKTHERIPGKGEILCISRTPGSI